MNFDSQWIIFLDLTVYRSSHVHGIDLFCKGAEKNTLLYTVNHSIRQTI